MAKLPSFIPQHDVDLGLDIDETIDQKFRRLLIFGLWLLITLVLGYIIGTVWDLNGKIYEVAGKQTIQYDVIDSLKAKIAALEKERSEIEEKLFKERQLSLNVQHNLQEELKNCSKANTNNLSNRGGK